MMGTSLRLRLVLAATASIVAALTLAGLALIVLFERHIERRIDDELGNHMRQLVAAIEVADNGALDVSTGLADPRFEQPLSGLYWQVERRDASSRRSRSLWDQQLSLPPAPLTLGASRQVPLHGPGGVPLVGLQRVIEITNTGKVHVARLAVAINRAEVDRPVALFRRELGWSLSLLALFLTAGAWAQIAVGLRPLSQLRRLLRRVRTGEDRRLTTSIATEVQPLVDEVNALLDSQERSIARARTRAADLAHGLKTPLTILGTIAGEQRAAGQTGPASEISAQVATMQHHIDRELVRARIASVGRPTPLVLRPEIERLVAAMRRMPRGDALQWMIDVPPDVAIAWDRADCAELLGTLLDNARKWATARVRISWTSGRSGELRIEDDGPGVPVGKIPEILTRGGRLDETREGSGFGLAIAGEIVEAYGAGMTVETSSMGGLAIVIGSLSLPLGNCAIGSRGNDRAQNGP
jgi:signal transduction histidine kinase